MSKKWKLMMLTVLVVALLLSACAPAAPKNGGNDAPKQNEEQKKDETKKDETKNDANAQGGAQKAVLKVGMECAYPPYNWTQVDDSNGAVKIEGSNEYAGGYDVEIAKKVAQALDMELVVVKTKWEGLIPSVNSNIIDLIMAGMTETPERAEAIDFSIPYYSSKLIVITKADSPFANAKTLADFKGAKLSAQLGTLHYDALNQFEGAEVQAALPDFTALRLALNSGSIDAYVGEEVEGVSALVVFDNFKVIQFEDGKGLKVDEAGSELVTVSVGMKKDHPNKEKINEVIKSITAEEQNAIMMKVLENLPAQN